MGGVSWQTYLSPYLSQPPPPRPEGGGYLADLSHKPHYVKTLLQ